ncbi:MAG: lysophospholipid acyltransferase family protein [Burkholderiaceae bacterium]
MQTLFKLASFLPLPVLRAGGFLLGISMWLGSARYRRDFNTQWSQALGYWRLTAPETRPPSKLRAIAQSGLLLSELPRVWCRLETAMAMEVSGLQEMSTALSKGKGLIILTPHLGAFELAARRIAREFPLTVLYRPARRIEIERLLQTFRSAEGVRPVPANAQGVRQLMRALKQGGAIGLLPDQVPSEGEGQVADFFGRPAYTMTLPIRMAQATGAAIIWAAALRTNAGWSLRLAPWRVRDKQGEETFFDDLLPSISLQEAVGLMNKEVEAQIARAPEQYLWGYNRYKKIHGQSL